MARHRTRIMYIEDKSEGLNGPARIVGCGRSASSVSNGYQAASWPFAAPEYASRRMRGRRYGPSRAVFGCTETLPARKAIA